MYRSEKFRRAVADIGVCMKCGAEDGTIVPCHQNEGKGMGLKVSDARMWAGCFRCHTEYDQGKTMSRDEKRDEAWRLIAMTLVHLVETGKLRLK